MFLGRCCLPTENPQLEPKGKAPPWRGLQAAPIGCIAGGHIALPRKSLGDPCGVAACGLQMCRHAEVGHSRCTHGRTPREGCPDVEMVPVLLGDGGKVDVRIHKVITWIGGQGHNAPEVCHKHAVGLHP